VIGQKNIAGGQIAVQNLYEQISVLFFLIVDIVLVNVVTFLLARNSIPLAICNDQDIKSLVLI
jgi:hypothetical protein